MIILRNVYELSKAISRSNILFKNLKRQFNRIPMNGDEFTVGNRIFMISLIVLNSREIMTGSRLPGRDRL